MDDSVEIMVGDFVQFEEHGEFAPVTKVLWEGVEYIDVTHNLETRFAAYDAIYAVVPNEEYRSMMGEGGRGHVA
jgi:hypothetical protein